MGVVGAVFERENVPPVGCPLVDEIVAVEFARDDPAQQDIVNTRVVIGQDNSEPLAYLQRDCLRLQFLRMPFRHCELAFERNHLRRAWRADHIPERGFACGGGNTHAGRPAVNVVRDIHGFGVASQRLYPAQLCLRKKRMVGQPLVFQECLQSTGAAAEPESVDGQDRLVGIGAIAFVARRLIFAFQRLAHDHPKRVTGGNVVAARQHELVAEGMFGAPVIVTQAAELRAGEVRGYVEWGVGERSAEVAGLRIVPQQHQGHAGHVPDVFEAFPAEGHVQRFDR